LKASLKEGGLKLGDFQMRHGQGSGAGDESDADLGSRSGKRDSANARGDERRGAEAKQERARMRQNLRARRSNINVVA